MVGGCGAGKCLENKSLVGRVPAIYPIQKHLKIFTILGDDLHKRTNHWAEAICDHGLIIVTGVVDEETVAEAAETDVDAYIIKPFAAKTLEDKIDEILDRHLNPDEFEILLSHGMADEAAQAFEGAIKINPENVHVYNRLGIALRKQGKYKEAIEHYKRALRVAPNDENIYYNLGKALIEARRNGDAKKAFESALKINPNFSEAREILATL